MDIRKMKIMNQNIDCLRRIGHTTFIVNATISNPNVIVLCESSKYAQTLMVLRNELIKQLPWYKRLFISRKKPKFLSVKDRYKIVGLHTPIVLDISSAVVAELNKTGEFK